MQMSTTQSAQQLHNVPSATGCVANWTAPQSGYTSVDPAPVLRATGQGLFATNAAIANSSIHSVATTWR